MDHTQTARLLETVADGVISPLNQTELKAANALLKEICKAEPAVAENSLKGLH